MPYACVPQKPRRHELDEASTGHNGQLIGPCLAVIIAIFILRRINDIYYHPTKCSSEIRVFNINDIAHVMDCETYSIDLSDSRGHIVRHIPCVVQISCCLWHTSTSGCCSRSASLPVFPPCRHPGAPSQVYPRSS